MKTCITIAEKAGVPNFLHAGTLLGYVRHNHSLIPVGEPNLFLKNINLLLTFSGTKMPILPYLLKGKMKFHQ